MTKVIDSRPVNDFLLDIFESEELAVNIVILNMGHSTGKPSIRQRNDSTRPPAKSGKVVTVRYTPVPLVQPKKGKR